MRIQALHQLVACEFSLKLLFFWLWLPWKYVTFNICWTWSTSIHRWFGDSIFWMLGVSLKWLSVWVCDVCSFIVEDMKDCGGIVVGFWDRWDLYCLFSQHRFRYSWFVSSWCLLLECKINIKSILRVEYLSPNCSIYKRRLILRKD